MISKVSVATRIIVKLNHPEEDPRLNSREKSATRLIDLENNIDPLFDCYLADLNRGAG